MQQRKERREREREGEEEGEGEGEREGEGRVGGVESHCPINLPEKLPWRQRIPGPQLTSMQKQMSE